MRVFIFSTGADTGGQGYRIHEAFERYEPGWTVDSLALNTKYMRYPAQFGGPASEKVRQIGPLYDAADVVHLRLTTAAYDRFDKGQNKPVVLHHHGSIFRQMHASLNARALRIGATQIASTLDLTLLERDVTWLPAPFDINALAAIREREYRSSGRIVVAHAPTNRTVKGTRHFINVMRHLGRRLPDLGSDVIERVTWDQCLARKARADIYYDQLGLGIGNNALEVMAMGIPVVAGVADPKVRARMVEVWGGLPFVETAPQDLEDTLRSLAQSPAMRQEYAERGLAHVWRFHAQEAVYGLLRGIYESAARSVRAAA